MVSVKMGREGVRSTKSRSWVIRKRKHGLGNGWQQLGAFFYVFSDLIAWLLIAGANMEWCGWRGRTATFVHCLQWVRVAGQAEFRNIEEDCKTGLGVGEMTWTTSVEGTCKILNLSSMSPNLRGRKEGLRVPRMEDWLDSCLRHWTWQILMRTKALLLGTCTYFNQIVNLGFSLNSKHPIRAWKWLK